MSDWLGRLVDGAHEWMAEEIPFLAADRPWERAGAIVAGTPVLDHDPSSQVGTAPPGPADPEPVPPEPADPG